MKNLEKYEPKIARLFKNEDGKFQIWKKTNMPILLETEKVFFQKQEYIHQNPVRKKYVKNPEDWIYSSANKETTIQCFSIFDD